MTKPNNSNFDLNDFDDFDFKKEFFKYFYYWKFFLASIIFFVVVAFSYVRYTAKVYNSVAKIKIIDKKESSLELPTATELFSNSRINLENEIEVIKSYPVISEVIFNKKLYTSVLAIGNIMKTLSVDYPFEVKLHVAVDSVSEFSYRLNKADKGFEIIDFQNKSKSYKFKGASTRSFKHDLPFEISNFNERQFVSEDVEGYEIVFTSVKDMVSKLKNSISVTQVGKESDIIQLEFNSVNHKYSEIVLNELIDVFNNDGVKDRQLIHKRTIDFVNTRYAFLSKELDSIEIAKQLYKANNDLVDLSANSLISLEKSNKSEDNIFTIENQISLTNLLVLTLNDSKAELLPSNIGIENREINELIIDYNSNVLERKKLIQSAGINNPSIKLLNNLLSDGRANIIISLRNYLEQLENTKKKLSKQLEKLDYQVSNLPEKEKVLRSIERNQKIKEALYLFLLQKREEAEVSYAVTEPSIKVVEYSISNNKPISPKSNIAYLIAVLLGSALPFITLYIIFMFNRKIYSKEQFENLNLPIPLLGEIPEITDQANTTIKSSKERSPLAESFRVLYSKLKFFNINREKEANIIMVTSTVKGEGKTFCAVNLAYTMSTLGKKVLLIGADLHNPQIHTYLDIDKNVDGLINFLIDNNFNWQKALRTSLQKCDVLVGGQIPPNPAELLNNGNLKKLLDEAKAKYDTIIIDTPPCLLVSDTLSISHLADLLLFVVRCNHTDMDVLQFLKDSYTNGVIKNNSMTILNGLGATNKYGYGYAYNYSYGYSYKYGYNYNYGYGYEYGSED